MVLHAQPVSGAMWEDMHLFVSTKPRMVVDLRLCDLNLPVAIMMDAGGDGNLSRARSPCPNYLILSVHGWLGRILFRIAVRRWRVSYSRYIKYKERSPKSSDFGPCIPLAVICKRNRRVRCTRARQSLVNVSTGVKCC